MDTGGPIFIDTVIVDPPLDPDPIGGGPILVCAPQLVNNQVVVGHLTGTVSLVNPCTGVITTVPVTSNPLQAAISPNGDLLAVSTFDNAVTFLDPKTLAMKSVITTDDSINPSGVAFSPDGSQLYVSSFSFGSGALLTIDVAKQTIVQTVQLPQYAQSVFLSPDGQRAYVTCPYNNAVYVVDTLTGTVIHGISIPYPIGMAFNPTGTRAYITSGTINGKLVEVDTSTNQFLRSVSVGNQPEDVVVTADGLEILVDYSQDGTVSMINALTFQNQVLQFDAGYIHGLTLLN
jgi:YVTN family beta-propeller protein